MMQLRFLPILTILFISLEGTAQQGTMQKSYRTGSNCLSMRPTYDGGCVIVGQTVTDDICLVKTNNNGTIVWKKTYGGPLYEHSEAVIQTIDSGFMIAGTTTSFGAGHSDAYLIKTDAMGNVVWSKSYGSKYWESAASVCQTRDGGFIVLGTYATSAMDIYLFKTDSIGELQWSKEFGGSGMENAYCVIETEDGGYLLAGETFSFGIAVGTMDALLIQTDSLGNFLWSKTYGETGNQSFFCVQPVKSGGYIMAGYTRRLNLTDDYVVRVDAVGNPLWSKKIGTAIWDRGTWIEETADHGFILSGTTAASYGIEEDGHLIKLDASGNYIWGKRYDRSANDNFRFVHERPDGTFYVAGNTLMPNDTGLVSEIYLLTLDNTGSAGCNEIPFDTVSTAFGTTAIPVYPVLTSSSTSTITPTQVDSAVVPVSTICLNGVGIEDREKSPASIAIFPNPTSGIITFTSQQPIAELRILNAVGQTISSASPNAHRATLNLGHLPAGLYFCIVHVGKGIFEKGSFVIR